MGGDTSLSKRRYRAFGLEWAPLAVPIERRLETLAAFFWINNFFIVGLGTPFFFLYLILCTPYYYIPLAYLLWLVWDWNTPKRGGRRLQWAREWRLWKSFANYFPVKLVKTAALNPNKNYIMGCHPHGILCASHFANFATEGTNFSQVFPGITPYLLPLNLLHCLPIFREVIMACGMGSVTKESINYLLRSRDGGVAAAIVIGGTAEVFDAHPGGTTIVLKNRKGFVKQALKNGASLVPVFSFGENSLYKQLDNPRGSMFRRFQDALRSIVTLSPVIFYGRGMFQYSLGIVPFRRELVSVVGAPIDVPKIENPTDEEVSKYHNMYMNDLNDIYEKYKHIYGEDPHSHLHFV